MTNQIAEFNKIAQEIQQLQAKVRPTYLSILTDKEISLEERWEFFKNAPSNFKKHGGYAPCLITLDNKDTNLSWYDDFYIERHETVDIVDIVVRLELQDGEGQVFTYFENNPEAIDLLKEEILRLNIGSFTYDW